MSKLAKSFCLFLVTAGTICGGRMAPAVAHESPLVGATRFRDATCQLVEELERRGASSYTLRSAARLEASAGALLAQLSCPHDVSRLRSILVDSQLWLERTSVGVESDCLLRDSRRVQAALDRVNCGYREVVEAVRYALAVPPIVDPFGALPQDNHRDRFGGFPPAPPIGYVPFGATQGQNLGNRDPFGASRGGAGFAPEIPARTIPRNPSPQPSGEIGRAVLGLILSEIGRR